MFNIVAIATLIKTDLLAFYNTNSYAITQVNRKDDNDNSGEFLDNDSCQKYTLKHIFLHFHLLSFIAEKLHKIKIFRKDLYP